MAIDWARALASGVESGAKAEQGVLLQQDEDARWLEKEKQLRAMEDSTARQRARFLEGLKPPETRKVSVAGADGKPAIQQQEWVMPAEGEDAGHFRDVGDQTPDINFERLEETQRHNTETEGLRRDADQARAESAIARLDLARERLDSANGRRTTAETQPKPYTFTDKNGQPIIRYGTFQDGKFQPALDETGAPIQGDKFRPSVFAEKQTANANAMKGTMRQFADALGLGAAMDTFGDPRPTMNAKPAAAPAAASSAPAGATINGKRVVKTGSKGGRRVAQLEDGSVVDAATGAPVQ